MRETEAGYLVDWQDWSPSWASEKASILSRPLSDFDWQLIAFTREFYTTHHIMPLTRRLIQFIRDHYQKDFDSLALQAYYTDKPLRIIALISGLPRPIQCI
jgi:tRNA 2-thiouridine synthesizing protein E